MSKRDRRDDGRDRDRRDDRSGRDRDRSWEDEGQQRRGGEAEIQEGDSLAALKAILSKVATQLRPLNLTADEAIRTVEQLYGRVLEMDSALAGEADDTRKSSTLAYLQSTTIRREGDTIVVDFPTAEELRAAEAAKAAPAREAAAGAPAGAPPRAAQSAPGPAEAPATAPAPAPVAQSEPAQGGEAPARPPRSPRPRQAPRKPRTEAAPEEGGQAERPAPEGQEA